MLKEIPNANQGKDREARRWFTCELFDLYLWQNAGPETYKFQICYKGRANPNPAEIFEDVLTWEKGVGFKFQRINIEQRLSTPLVQDVAPFDVSEIRYEFASSRHRISDPALDLIAQKMSELDGP